jgi:hypothetical protein
VRSLKRGTRGSCGKVFYHLHGWLSPALESCGARHDRSPEEATDLVGKSIRAGPRVGVKGRRETRTRLTWMARVSAPSIALGRAGERMGRGGGFSWWAKRNIRGRGKFSFSFSFSSIFCFYLFIISLNPNLNLNMSFTFESIIQVQTLM